MWRAHTDVENIRNLKLNSLLLDYVRILAEQTFRKNQGIQFNAILKANYIFVNAGLSYLVLMT